MAWIEEVTKANVKYFATRRAALKHNPGNIKGRCKGIRRDQVMARASREHRAALAKVGVTPR
ncbi:MAG: hypothetical protein E6J34_24280 [Chloroflexi bacterium]|nr:MAG: hypothetical protein E6J34_24280 [Chloroflexota bacterium]